MRLTTSGDKERASKDLARAASSDFPLSLINSILPLTPYNSFCPITIFATTKFKPNIKL